MFSIFYYNLFFFLLLCTITTVYSFIIINDTDRLYPYDSLSDLKLPFSILKSSTNERKQTTQLDVTSLIDYMKSIYDQTNYHLSTSKYIFRNGNTIRAIAPKLIELNNVTQFIFDLNVIKRSESVTSAELHLYKRRTKYTIRYEISEIYSINHHSSISGKILLDNFVIGWQNFPITDVLARTIQYSKNNSYFGLTLKPFIIKQDGQSKEIPYLQKFSVYTPFLVVYSNDSKSESVFEEFIPSNLEKSASIYEDFEKDVRKRNNGEQQQQNIVRMAPITDYFAYGDILQLARKKRSVSKLLNSINSRYQRYSTNTTRALSTITTTATTPDNNLLPDFDLTKESSKYLTSFLLQDQKCSVKSFAVDFSDIGWSDWIIEPKRYMANLCSGSCEFQHIRSGKSTNHALLQSMIRRLGVRSDTQLPAICCNPEKYSSLPVFYKSSEQNYFIRLLPDMIIDSCHCR